MRFCFYDGTPIAPSVDGFAECEQGHVYGDDFLDTLEKLADPPVADMPSMDEFVIEAYGWVGQPGDTVPE